jgi:hypothetical protein
LVLQFSAQSASGYTSNCAFTQGAKSHRDHKRSVEPGDRTTK